MVEKNIEFSLLAHQIEHEKTLRRLYKSYSEIFPEEEIWLQLEKEEKKHAAWIQQIISKICDETVYFNEDPECCENIKRSLSIMNDEIAKAKNNEIDLMHAFKVAIEIEESMVEREFFKSMESDAPFVGDVLKKIIADTERHKDSLIDAKNIFLKTVDLSDISKPEVKEKNTKERSKQNDNAIPYKEIDLDRELDPAEE